MSDPTDRLPRASLLAALWRRGPVVGVCVGSMLLALACDPESGGREDERSPGNGRLEELEQAIGPALSQAAAHVRDESNWVEPDGETPSDGGASEGGDGSDGGDPGGGASCAGSCGAAAPDGSCYCDAGCGSNGDCCSDYAQHCGGGGDGGGGDGGGDAGDGGGASSCAGACGGVGSDGACYCDSACSGNGDCCGDYEQQCGGGSGSGSGSGGGDGGNASTCNGYCGGVGSDGACYCDEACQENGDCCGDFATWCAAGIADDASLGFTSRLPTLESDGACWGIITDPVDVERIATAATVGGVAVGSSCVAMLVVPATAAAVPSGGISVGATALACSTSALGGAATGALVDLASQKMGSIAQCSADIVAQVMQIFPWGVGEKKIDVPVFTTSPTDPGNCTPDDKDALQQEVNDVCKNAGTRSCSFADSCPTIQTKIDTAAQCIDARQRINSQCFDGGDAGHNTAVQQEVNLQNNCWSISSSVGC